jgi:hypothetical protein
MHLCPYRVFVPLNIGIDQGITTGTHGIGIFNLELHLFAGLSVHAQMFLHHLITGIIY